MGGPILPNRTFFFFGYEAMRDRTSRARSLNSPTTNERRGDFSPDGVLLGRDIFDPFNVMERRRVRFPNNTIPHDRFNPVTQNIMNSMFAPSTSRTDSRRSSAGPSSSGPPSPTWPTSRN